MPSPSRVLAPAMLAGALFVSGCSTLTLGQRYAGPSQAPHLLDLCVFTPGTGVIDRATAQMILGGAVGTQAMPGQQVERFTRVFRNATYVRNLDDSQGCDVMMKVVGRNLVSTKMPAELYSARSKKLLKRFDAAITGESGTAALASAALMPGGGLYETVMAEAGPARRSQTAPAESAPASAASFSMRRAGESVPQSAPASAPSGVTKDELRQMMAEAVKAAKEEAPAGAAAPTSDADAPRYATAEDSQRYAVVVGVEKYNALPDASYAERDAKAVYEHLVALGWPRRNIALLTGAQATRTGLVKNLEAWLPQNVGDSSTVFFYYSGHGAPDAAAGTAYLVPSDGDPQYLEETGYPVKRLYEKLGALKARRVLVAMDACFSGAGGRSVLPKGTRPLVGKIDTGVVGGKVVALTASASNQVSGSVDAQGHGLFTYYLLRGLNGDALDSSGHLTVGGLHRYLAPKVMDEAKRANRDQAPQLLPAQPVEDFQLR